MLTAFQDVEDSLIALRILERQGVFQNLAAKNAKTTLHIMKNQYKAGVVPYSSVVTSMIAAHNAQKAASDVVGEQMVSAVSLIKSLGGGWNVRLLSQPNTGVK